MPRLDNPNAPLRIPKPKKFMRKGLRPWDNAEKFQPANPMENKTFDNQLVNIKKPVNNQIGIELVNTGSAISNHKEPISNQPFIPEEPISNPISKHIEGTVSKQLANRVIENPEMTSPLDAIKLLSGLQRKAFFYIVENCKSRGQLSTTPITNETLRFILQTDANTAKTTIQRIINKFLITRDIGKRGKGGFTIYTITERIRNAAIEAQRIFDISKQIESQLVTKFSNQIENNRDTNWETSTASSSSSFNNNKTTTTEADTKNLQLDAEWEEINLHELNKKGVPFTRNHIINLWDFLKGYSAFEFQESVDGYVFDIDNKYINARNGYLNFFIGCIRNKQLYTSSHYMSPERKKMQDMVELLKKRKIDEEDIKQEFENKKFNEWLESYDIENLKKQLPVWLIADFAVRGKDSLAWVKDNIYRKERRE